MSYIGREPQIRDLTKGLDTVEKIDAVVWPTKPGA